MKKILTIISGITLVAALILGWLDLLAPAARTVYLISILSGGYFVFLAAIRGLFKQRFLNINLLVTIAAVGAIYINQLVEAAAVVFFFSLAEAFKEFGLERSRKALEALIKKRPQTAVLANGEKVPVKKVKVKEIVIIPPRRPYPS